MLFLDSLATHLHVKYNGHKSKSNFPHLGEVQVWMLMLVLKSSNSKKVQFVLEKCWKLCSLIRFPSQLTFYTTSLLSPSRVIDVDTVLNYGPSPPKFQFTISTVNNTKPEENLIAFSDGTARYQNITKLPLVGHGFSLFFFFLFFSKITLEDCHMNSSLKCLDWA